MHLLFAALFSLLFSFSHAASVRQSEADGVSATAHTRYGMEYTPTHRELLQTEVTAARYAEAACVSCRRMNFTYRVH